MLPHLSCHFVGQALRQPSFPRPLSSPLKSAIQPLPDAPIVPRLKEIWNPGNSGSTLTKAKYRNELTLMRKTTKHVFAVLRFDGHLADIKPAHQRVTVKEVVMTKGEAESEVQRLTAVNRGKRCEYSWQLTRLVDKPS